MSAIVDLDTTLSNLLSSLPLQKAKRNESLTQLRDVLDMYLFSVMEEEDPLYRLLHQRSEYVLSYNYKSVKILSPFSLQFKILMTLPFQPHQMQVSYGEPSFVKLKLPPSSDTEITASRVWIDACHRGIQEDLQSHLSLWKDENDYLKQTAFLKWFETVVDKSLYTTGKIPNYNIFRLNTSQKVTLAVEELSSGFKFTVELLPVIAFPLSQLPDNLSEIFQDSVCNEWMVECRCSAVGSDLLWGINLWQHERAFIKRNSHLKSTIQVLKCLRDGCKWNELKNYHIRTLVMTCHKRSPTMFDSLTPGTVLLFLLLELRNGLVSKTGLPFFWDEGLNLLCGLNGLQRSELARSITRTRDRLQSFDESCNIMFWLDTYSVPAQGATEGSLPDESASSLEVEYQPSSRHHPTEQQARRNMFPSHVSGQPRDNLPQRTALQMGMRQESNVDWGKIATAGAAVASAVAAIAGIAWYRKSRNN